MQLSVTIKRGKVTMDVNGGHGPSCEQATEGYVNRLAEGAVERTLKPEHGFGGDDREHVRQSGD